MPTRRALPTNAQAGRCGAHPDEIHVYEQIDVTGRSSDLVGTADSATEGVTGHEDLEKRPVLRPGEVLETVPGVVITQHSGSGKANQYYARGFNLDHGTDFRVTVDGIDVNMPSHGHGQGYSDLNFLISELVDSVSGLNKSTELGGFPDEERDEERASGPDAKSPGTGGHPNLGMKRIEPVRYAGREVERGP